MQIRSNPDAIMKRSIHSAEKTRKGTQITDRKTEGGKERKKQRNLSRKRREPKKKKKSRKLLGRDSLPLVKVHTTLPSSSSPPSSSFRCRVGKARMPSKHWPMVHYSESYAATPSSSILIGGMPHRKSTVDWRLRVVVERRV